MKMSQITILFFMMPRLKQWHLFEIGSLRLSLLHQSFSMGIEKSGTLLLEAMMRVLLRWIRESQNP